MGIVQNVLEEYFAQETSNGTVIIPTYQLFPSLNPDRYLDIRSALYVKRQSL